MNSWFQLIYNVLALMHDIDLLLDHAVLLILFVLPMQECNDLSVDLRFYESSDGSVMLESVTSPSSHLLVNGINRLYITSVVSACLYIATTTQ